MTTTNNTQNNGGADEFTSAYNVISVSFDPDSNAYAALTALKEMDSQGQLNLEAAAVVARGDDGQIEVKDRVGSYDYAGAASGGLLGLLIGIIGGPLGVLIGGTYGLMARLAGRPRRGRGDRLRAEPDLGVGAAPVTPRCSRRSPSRALRSSTPPWRASAAACSGERWTTWKPRSRPPRRPSATRSGRRPRSCAAAGASRPAAGPRQGGAAQGEDAAPRDRRPPAPSRRSRERAAHDDDGARVRPLANSDDSAAGRSPDEAVRPRGASSSETRDTVGPRRVEVSISIRTILLVAGAVASRGRWRRSRTSFS